jgi:hypothetical protein
VFESIISSYASQAGAIEYHCNWPGTDPYSNYAALLRVSYYGISGIPAGGVDGTMNAYSGWLSAFTSRLSVSAPISITLEGTYSPILHKAYITAHVHCDTAMTGSSHNIYVAITEDNLDAAGRHYNRVERAMNLNGWGESFSISPGQDVNYNCEITYGTSWKTDDLKILCFVQAGQSSTKEIQNSKWANWSILTPAVGVTPSSLGNIKAAFH